MAFFVTRSATCQAAKWLLGKTKCLVVSPKCFVVFSKCFVVLRKCRVVLPSAGLLKRGKPRCVRLSPWVYDKVTKYFRKIQIRHSAF